MEKTNYFPSLAGANWSTDQENETLLQHKFLYDFTRISESSFFGVIAYTVIFVVASIGHLFSFTYIWKQFLNKKSRIFLILLHLSVADLIVCLVIVPTEIVWRLSVQWDGGNILCKATQYFRAFGLYLSSLIVICLSIDRFISIIFQPDVIGVVKYRRIKWMISIAWIASAVFSAPQAILFRVESHPNFPDFQQCITSEPDDPQNISKVKVYSIFSLAVMYFVPLVIIMFTYTLIVFKLVTVSQDLHRSRAHSGIEFQTVSIPTGIGQDGGVPMYPTNNSSCQFTTSVQANLTKAKIHTLMMTVIIIFAFVVCWTPYAIMTLWYIVDWEEAKKVDPRIQDAFFLMVVSNSCVNPLIYGGFCRRKNTRRGKLSFC